MIFGWWSAFQCSKLEGKYSRRPVFQLSPSVHSKNISSANFVYTKPTFGCRAWDAIYWTHFSWNGLVKNLAICYINLLKLNCSAAGASHVKTWYYVWKTFPRHILQCKSKMCKKIYFVLEMGRILLWFIWAFQRVPISCPSSKTTR